MRIIRGLHLTVDLYLTGLTMLGGDEDNAVSTLGAVDSRSRGILQHREVLDILDVDVIDIVALKAIHQDVGLVAGTEGRDTTNPEFRSILTRLTGLLKSHDARHVTCQRIGEVRRAVVLQVGHLHGGDGTSDSQLLLRTHTRDHHLVDGILYVLLHGDVYRGLVLDENLLSFHADIREDECLVLVHLDFVFTVVVGDGTQSLRVFHNNAGTYDGFTSLVNNPSCDVHFFLSQGLYGRTQQEY